MFVSWLFHTEGRMQGRRKKKGKAEENGKEKEQKNTEGKERASFSSHDNLAQRKVEKVKEKKE